MKCQGDDGSCGRKASHRFAWKNADVSLLLCVEHMNVFIQDDVVVTTDLESPWRLPLRGQTVLDELATQGLEHLEEGRKEEAGQTLGLCQAHVTNCNTAGLELDEDKYEELERRLVGDVI